MRGLVYLTGFMGAGKSTVGRIVAARLDLPFIDLDGEIEEHCGRTIADIFAEDGEEAFRAVEYARLKEIGSGGRPAVVACGGGIVTRESNVSFMRETGTVVYLRVEAGDVAGRVLADGTRPLWGSDEAAVEGLLFERRSAYESSADVVVEAGSSFSPEEVADAVVALVGAS